MRIRRGTVGSAFGAASLGTVALFAFGCSTPLNPDCVAGPARPLGVSTVVGALRREGFSAEPTTRECGPGTVATVTNSPGPDADEELIEREGHLICSVEKEPYPKAFLQRFEDERKVVWTVANLTCAVYFTEEGKEDQLRRLGVAMRELATAASA